MSYVKSLIKMRTAAEMIDRYDQFRKNQQNDNFQWVQSIQFSIQGIEDYLKYVKTLSRLNGVKVSGIRVFNAIYSPNHADEKKRNQHTVLFIPTYRCNNEDVAFDPLYIQDGKPEDLSKLLNEATQVAGPDRKDEKDTENLVVYSMQYNNSSFMNFGNMGRPPV